MKHTAHSSIPRHRKDAVSFSNEAEARARMLQAEFCGYCKKLSLPTEADARSYIGLLIRTTPRKPMAFTLHPYPCPHHEGQWHVGRDRKTVALLKGESR
jgi:hypothetical protein